MATSTEAILLAALARCVAATVGEGVAMVDLAGTGRAVLRPEVDFRRTIGWFATIYPIALPCIGDSGASASQLLEEVSRTLKDVPHQGVGYGLLRYLHAPTARLLGVAGSSDIFLSYLGMVPEWQDGDGLDTDAAVRFDSDSERTVRETPAGLGHALELRSYRQGGVIHLDWWCDVRRMPAAAVEDLAARFPATLIELLDDALTGGDTDDSEAEDEALALVDLSAAVFDDDE
jgi:phthiocerol/phenolphthiocerol synthesis type-I polyketide synthase E